MPLCLIALLGVWAFIKDAGKQQGLHLDWTGFLALSISVASLQIMLDRGERHDWFETLEIVVITALMALTFYIFVVHTVTTDKPFVRIRRGPRTARFSFEVGRLGQAAMSA